MGRNKINKSFPWVKPVEKKIQGGRLERENRYNSTRWRTVSRLYLMENPLCEVSKSEGVIRAANVTDHRHPVRFGGDFWKEENFQALSHEIHNKKSGFESQLMGLMMNLELEQKCSAYLYVESRAIESEGKQMFLIDFEIVKNFFQEWRSRRGYGVKS